MQQLPLSVRIPDRAVFSTFLTARNIQAVDHLTLVAGGHRSETTWICGLHGHGKTHLLQAVCVQASESAQAAYYPMRDLASLGVGVLEELPPLACLCIDDVDAITGKREWERALFVVLRDMQGARRAARTVRRSAARADPLVAARSGFALCGQRGVSTASAG